MSDTIKITLIIILGLITLNLIANRSNADEELIQALQRKEEIPQLILEKKNDYAIAEWAYNECKDSWQWEMDKAHNEAEVLREELKKLEGFIQSRQAQK